MFYIKYEDDTKLVVGIYPTEPQPEEGYSIARSYNFEPGMELEYVITVDTLNQDGAVTASSTTKQTVPAYQILKELHDTKEQNIVLQQQVADLEMAMAAVLGGAV